MTRQANAVYAIGTEVLEKYSYGYDYAKGFDDLWKKRLKYVEDAGVETPNARTKRFCIRGGRRLISEPFPRQLIKEGPKRKVADFERTLAGMLVSEAFRAFVEGLEPERHQFEPVEILWKDGSHAAHMYIFIICAALDSIATEHVEGTRQLIDFGYGDGVKRLGPWGDSSGSGPLLDSKMVFDLKSISDNCVWQDEFLVSAPLCSNVFKEAYEVSGLIGACFGERESI